jgi:hypothetical protein
MTYKMVHFAEIQNLRASLQFLSFAEAYLYSAFQLCSNLASTPSQSTYPRGTVVLSLSYHGIELFFKAAILEKKPGEQFKGKSGHDLEFLGKRYAKLYPDGKFAFEIPFGTEEIELVTPDPGVVEEIDKFMANHKKATPPDQINRYPRDIEGKPWHGIYAFEPTTFSFEIDRVRNDVTRLKEIIFKG